MTRTVPGVSVCDTDVFCGAAGTTPPCSTVADLITALTAYAPTPPAPVVDLLAYVPTAANTPKRTSSPDPQFGHCTVAPVCPAGIMPTICPDGFFMFMYRTARNELVTAELLVALTVALNVVSSVVMLSISGGVNAPIAPDTSTGLP